MKKPYGYVYKIVCKVNGKHYVGQTIRTISERWRSHISDSKKEDSEYKLPISRAIAKYSVENFSIHIVCIANNQQELDNREIMAIRLYDSIKNGYNIHTGGLNQPLSKQTKAKISIGNKGKKRTQKQKENYRNARLGTKQPLSVKIKCSTSQIGEKSAWWGRKHSEETKSKIGAAHKGKIISEQQREKQRKFRSGKKASLETRQKMSVSGKGKKRNQKSLLCLENGIVYVSVIEAARQLGISLNSLGHYLRGKLKTAQGFTFRRI